MEKAPEKRKGGYTAIRQNSKLLKAVTKDKEGHVLYSDEGVNSVEGLSNYKHLSTQYQST